MASLDVAGTQAPPPRTQLPPATVGPRVAARRRRRRLMAAEAAAAALLIGGLSVAFHRPAPPPVDERQLWLARAGPALDALAVEVAHASAAPDAPGTAAQLRATATPLQRAGPPPDPTAAKDWEQALDDTSRAAASAGAARSQLLDEAGLALVTVQVQMRSA